MTLLHDLWHWFTKYISQAFMPNNYEFNTKLNEISKDYVWITFLCPLSLFLCFPNKTSLLKFNLIFFSDLVHCTNEPNVSIPSLANLLIERSQNASWIVVFKSLITTHHLLAYGNEVSKGSRPTSSTCHPILSFISWNQL